MTREVLASILIRTSYPGWMFYAVPMRSLQSAGRDGWLVYGIFDRPDADSGLMSSGASRYEYITEDATEDWVVKTLFHLVETTIRHEVMEFFRLDGKRVFDPHVPSQLLAETSHTYRERNSHE